MSNEELESARRDLEEACGEGIASAVYGFGEDWLRGFVLKPPEKAPERDGGGS